MLVTTRKAARLTARQRATVRNRGAKARNPEQRRQWEIAARSEPRFVRAFQTLMRSLFTEEMARDLRRALARDGVTVESALAAIPFFDPDDPETFAIWERFSASLQRAYTAAVTDAFETEARARGWSLPTVVTKIRAPGAKFPGVPVNPSALQYIQSRSLARAVDLSDDVRDTMRAILTDGFAAGIHPNAMVAEIKATIGLTKSQRARVKARAAAMRAAEFEQLLIDESEEEFSDQLRTQRAKAIARTESLDAQSHGREEAWNVARDEGLMPDNTQERWVATADARTSEICEELDGQTVPLGESFESTIVGSVRRPPAHPNCRSTKVLVFPEE